jgi:hypothetical protein
MLSRFGKKVMLRERGTLLAPCSAKPAKDSTAMAEKLHLLFQLTLDRRAPVGWEILDGAVAGKADLISLGARRVARRTLRTSVKWRAEYLLTHTTVAVCTCPGGLRCAKMTRS